MTGPTYSLQLRVPRTWLVTANHRQHWREKAKRTKLLRDAAFIQTRSGLGNLHLGGRWRCVVEVAWPDRRHRDAANLHPTIKACIDGIVGDAHLLADDSDAHLEGPDVRPAGVLHQQDGVACLLTFTFTPAESDNR